MWIDQLLLLLRYASYSLIHNTFTIHRDEKLTKSKERKWWTEIAVAIERERDIWFYEMIRSKNRRKNNSNNNKILKASQHMYSSAVCLAIERKHIEVISVVVNHSDRLIYNKFNT